MYEANNTPRSRPRGPGREYRRFTSCKSVRERSVKDHIGVIRRAESTVYLKKKGRKGVWRSEVGHVGVIKMTWIDSECQWV